MGPGAAWAEVFGYGRLFELSSVFFTAKALEHQEAILGTVPVPEPEPENGERGTGDGERGTGNGERGTVPEL